MSRGGRAGGLRAHRSTTSELFVVDRIGRTLSFWGARGRPASTAEVWMSAR